MEKFTRKKAYMCYIVGACEQGSEGWSSMMYPMVAYGDTDLEVLNDYAANIKALYGEDIIGNVEWYNNEAHSYYPIHKVKIPLTVYGSVQDYSILLKVKPHNDSVPDPDGLYDVLTEGSPIMKTE